MGLNGFKYKKEWSILFIFLLKITSRACFLGSGLYLTFHWKSQSLIFIKSLFRSFAAESLYFERRRTERCIRSYHPRCHPLIQGLNYIFEGLSWKVILSQPYVRWIRIKTHSPTNFPSPKDNILLTVTENKFIAWNYSSSRSTGIYFIEFNNNDSRIKWEVCSKLTVIAPDVVLVSLLLTLIIFDRFF